MTAHQQQLADATVQIRRDPRRSPSDRSPTWRSEGRTVPPSHAQESASSATSDTAAKTWSVGLRELEQLAAERTGTRGIGPTAWALWAT